MADKKKNEEALTPDDGGEFPQEIPSPSAPLPQGERGEERTSPPAPLPHGEGNKAGADGDVVARDIRTDPFLVLVVRRNGATGYRLGTMDTREIVSVSGDLTADDKGLIAWFSSLPGEVRFRDGTRVVVRADGINGTVAEVL